LSIARIAFVLLLAVASSGLLVTVTACEPADWTSTEYLKKQLVDGDRIKALEEMSKLPSDKQRELVPTLVDLHKQDKDADRVFAILTGLRDPAAKEVYVATLKNAPSNRDRASAAIALGDIGAKDQIPAMLEAFRAVPNQDLRRSILEAFKAMPDATELPLLQEILTKYDPDRESLAYHAFSCEIITSIGQYDDKTIEAVVYGMYLDNATGQNVYKECATAVIAAGPLAVDPLIKALKGENEPIKTRFAKYPSFVEGPIEIKAVEVLGLIRDPRAVDPLLEEVQRVRSAPPHYRDDKLLTFAQNRIQFFVFTTDALGNIGDPKAIEYLDRASQLEKKAIEPYQGMIDYDKRAKHDIVQGAAAAIGRIGDRDMGLPILYRIASSGDIPELAKYGSEAFAYQSRWEAASEYAFLADGSKVDDMDKLIAKEKVADVKAKFETYKGMIMVAKECGAQAACYAGYLKGADKDKAAKAALELGRLDSSPAVREALHTALASEDLGLRLVVINALHKVGDAGTIEAIDKLLADEESRRGGEFKNIHFKVKALRAYLSNKGK